MGLSLGLVGDPPESRMPPNIYVSAVLSPAGPSGRVLQALHRRVFAAISSPAILDEVVDVLTRSRVMRRTQLEVTDIAKLRVWLERNTEVIKGEYQNLDVVPTDAKDNPVAAAALESKAPYLVTQDATDLLSLKAFHVSGHAIVQIAVFYVDNHMRKYTGQEVVRYGWRIQDKRAVPVR